MARMERALTRAGFSVLKKSESIPKTEEEFELLRLAYLRICKHAEKLGW